MRQNPGKIRRSIQAVLKVVFAPAQLWERGARYFVVRLYVLERLDEAAAFFGRSMILDSKAFRRAVRVKLFTPYVYRSISWLFEARLALNMLCQDKRHAGEGGSRLEEGRTEVMPSKAARSDRKLGANGCREAPWSKELTATLRN